IASLRSEELGDVLDVVVPEALDPRPAQRGAGHEARMAELVHQDQVAGTCEHRQDPDVREIAAAEHDRLAGLLERGEALLERVVERMIAGYEPGSAGARAVAARRFDARRDDARIGRQAEVVVTRERDELAAPAPRAASVGDDEPP